MTAGHFPSVPSVALPLVLPLNLVMTAGSCHCGRHTAIAVCTNGAVVSSLGSACHTGSCPE